MAGELEYILPKYCSPDPSWHERRGKGRWPSEERLRKIDVHAESLPQATLAEIVTLLPNRTLLLMGDSVMEQFYNTLQVIGRGAPIEEFRNDLAIVVVAQCFLQKESLEVPNSKEFLSFVSQTAPLWRMGKRKKPPKLPQQARGGMRMLYARVTTMQPDEVEAAIGTADVVVINWGLHYQRMNEYQLDLQHAFAVFEKYASRPGKAVIFQARSPSHGILIVLDCPLAIFVSYRRPAPNTSRRATPEALQRANGRCATNPPTVSVLASLWRTST